MHPSIFLIGTQRSGTTLLGRMLSAHKDIFIKNEIPILHVFTPGASREDIEAAIDKSVLDRHGKLIAELLESEGKSVWGVKDPQLTDHLEALKLFLPDARFIILIRDARAVVRSYMENAWGLGTNCYTGALRWKREVEAQLAFERSIPDNTLRLHYENLVTDPEQHLKKICTFLNIPFDSGMLNYTSKKAFVSNNRQSINTFKALDLAIITKWKSELSDHQIRVINCECGELLATLGYEVDDHRSYAKVPGWLKRYYNFHQLVLGEIQIQYRWRINKYKQNYQKWLANRARRQLGN